MPCTPPPHCLTVLWRLCCVCQGPGATRVHCTLTYALPLGGAASVEDSSFSLLWRRFLKRDDEFRNARWKVRAPPPPRGTDAPQPRRSHVTIRAFVDVLAPMCVRWSRTGHPTDRRGQLPSEACRWHEACTVGHEADARLGRHGPVLGLLRRCCQLQHGNRSRRHAAAVCQVRAAAASCAHAAAPDERDWDCLLRHDAGTW